MKRLVVYYSLSGNTGKLAKQLADSLNADLDVIMKKKSGPFTAPVNAFESMLKKTPLITNKKDPQEYDLVIVGTPINAFNLCSPVRSYLSKNNFKKVAFFATMEGSGADGAFKDMEKLSSKPIATLQLGIPDFKRGLDKEKIKAFIDSINHG